MNSLGTCPRVGALHFVKGNPVDVHELIVGGEIIVIECFATWCGPCHKSIPHVSALQRKYPSITVVGVSTSDDAQKLQGFVQQYGDQIAYRIAADNLGAIGALSQQFNVKGIPHAFVIGNGNVFYSGHPMQSEFEETIERLVKDKAMRSFTREELQSKTIKELKVIMVTLRVSPRGCIEKSDMVDKIVATCSA